MSDSDEADDESGDDSNEEEQGTSMANTGSEGSERNMEPQTEIIGKLKHVTKWKRLNQIPLEKRAFRFGGFGNSMAVKIILPLNTNVWDLLRTLGYYERRIFFTSIETNQRSIHDLSFNVQEKLSPKVQYALECLTSRHPSVRQRVSPAFIEKLLQSEDKKCIDALERYKS